MLDVLHAVLLLELDVLLPEGVDSVDHALHELDLGVAETVLVGDVVGVACKGKEFRGQAQNFTRTEVHLPNQENIIFNNAANEVSASRA